MLPVLLLGRGFVGEYLCKLLDSHGISDYASTTTDGRNGTIKWSLSEDNSADADYSALPTAQSVVITFPLKGKQAAKRLVDSYLELHRASLGGSFSPRWIYLGSTRPFKAIPSTRFTPADAQSGGPRVEAEEYIIQEQNGYVLNLAGLWGGERAPDKWARFYTDKERLRNRLEDRSLHLIHGADAARAIYALVSYKGAVLPAGRWLISDGRVHDVLQIIIQDERIRGFVAELLEEKPVQELLGADSVGLLGLGESAVTMRIDASHFWSDFGTEPKFPYAVGQPDPFAGKF
ncbi:hypothetical protein GQ54DRAFT_210809 [Martensiomyces pterosporus]|nr:hypothetical protein GQ54DRAFT_210809 [Martensiomyces pterosporus]